MDSLTFKENMEYEVILSKLHLDVGRKQWIAGYPFNTLVEKLIDNYGQARGCMSRMEARLLKKGRVTATRQTLAQGHGPRPGIWSLAQSIRWGCHGWLSLKAHGHARSPSALHQWRSSGKT
jgi:hypothetical protein